MYIEKIVYLLVPSFVDFVVTMTIFGENHFLIIKLPHLEYNGYLVSIIL